jgi:CoA:oxalate CoA-transferase
VTAIPSALEGTTVLDLTQQLPGPYATLLLASLGARVIKVEPPTGDFARTLDPAMFANVNAGKQSVVLDLKRPEGQEALRRLAADSEVFVEGFRPGVADRLGAGYAELSAVRPDIVYCSISGFGADGPYRAVPGHDINYLGLGGGVGRIAGESQEAGHIGIPMVDLASGTMACVSMLAALLRRRATGKGAFLDVAMLDSAVHWAGVKPPSDADGASEPAYGVIVCGDGLAISFAALEDKFWRALCGALGWEDWLTDPQYVTHGQRRHRAGAIADRLRAAMARRPRRDWLEILWAADVPVAPVHGPGDVPSDPQVQARGLFVDDAEAPGGQRLAAPMPSALRPLALSPAPALGADTEAVLRKLRRDSGPAAR